MPPKRKRGGNLGIKKKGKKHLSTNEALRKLDRVSGLDFTPDEIRKFGTKTYGDRVVYNENIFGDVVLMYFLMNKDLKDQHFLISDHYYRRLSAVSTDHLMVLGQTAEAINKSTDKHVQLLQSLFGNIETMRVKWQQFREYINENRIYREYDSEAMVMSDDMKEQIEPPAVTPPLIPEQVPIPQVPQPIPPVDVVAAIIPDTVPPPLLRIDDDRITEVDLTGELSDTEPPPADVDAVAFMNLATQMDPNTVISKDEKINNVMAVLYSAAFEGNNLSNTLVNVPKEWVIYWLRILPKPSSALFTLRTQWIDDYPAMTIEKGRAILQDFFIMTIVDKYDQMKLSAYDAAAYIYTRLLSWLDNNFHNEKQKFSDMPDFPPWTIKYWIPFCEERRKWWRANNWYMNNQQALTLLPDDRKQWGVGAVEDDIGILDKIDKQQPKKKSDKRKRRKIDKIIQDDEKGGPGGGGFDYQPFLGGAAPPPPQQPHPPVPPGPINVPINLQQIQNDQQNHPDREDHHNESNDALQAGGVPGGPPDDEGDVPEDAQSPHGGDDVEPPPPSPPPPPPPEEKKENFPDGSLFDTKDSETKDPNIRAKLILQAIACAPCIEDPRIVAIRKIYGCKDYAVPIDSIIPADTTSNAILKQGAALRKVNKVISSLNKHIMYDSVPGEADDRIPKITGLPAINPS